MPRGRNSTATAQKLDWLKAHRDLWTRVPPWPAPVPADGKRQLEALRVAAIDAGLYSRKSYWRDVESSLRKLIQLLKPRLPRNFFCRCSGAGCDRCQV